MDHRFRNRLVGIIALVFVMIIFLPSIFHEKSKYKEPSIPLNYESNDEDILGAFMTAELSAPSDENSNKNNEQNNLITQQNVSNIVETGSATEQHDQQYLVQLVTLKNARRVEGLTALLILNNFSVLTKPEKPIDGQLTVLFVGPYSSKDEAKTDMALLKELTKLTGKIVTNK